MLMCSSELYTMEFHNLIYLTVQDIIKLFLNPRDQMHESSEFFFMFAVGFSVTLTFLVAKKFV
jgi:hypothetical protein